MYEFDLTVTSMFTCAQGDSTKMSASEARTAIYLTDSPKEIKNKINRMAFSGGGNTVEEHRANGGNTATDVSFRCQAPNPGLSPQTL
jgi:tryptophanyl-tRNA synthetase